MARAAVLAAEMLGSGWVEVVRAAMAVSDSTDDVRFAAAEENACRFPGTLPTAGAFPNGVAERAEPASVPAAATPEATVPATTPVTAPATWLKTL